MFEWLLSFNMPEVIGAAGLILLLLAFWLNHKKKFKRYTYAYNGLNLFGALLMAFYSYSIKANVYLALNIIWAFIGLYFIVKKLREHEPIHEIDDFFMGETTIIKPSKKRKRKTVRKKKEKEEGTGPMPWFQ